MSERKQIVSNEELQRISRDRNREKLTRVINQMISICANAVDARTEIDRTRLMCTGNPDAESLVQDLSFALGDFFESGRKTLVCLWSMSDRLGECNDVGIMIETVIGSMFSHQLTTERKDWY